MLALLAAGFAMVIGCSNGSSDDDSGGKTEGTTVTPKFADVTEIKLEQNQEYGSEPPVYLNNQAVVEFLAKDNKWVGKKGDKVTITMVATTDAAPTVQDKKKLGGALVDTTEAANWWTVLVEDFIGDKEIVTEETEYKFAFTLTKDATSADPAACKFVLCFGDKNNYQATPVTLKVKSFDVKVE